MRKTVYVAHGAISNSGDFLIFHRGWSLLERYLDTEKVELVPVKRWEPITGQCDALIILGGPIVSPTIHPQAVNIKEYLEKNKVPVICLGVGISGKGYSAMEPYFADQESVDFWTEVYNSSQLISVRDVYTCQVLRDYNIPAVLTGCPALYDLEFISSEETAGDPLEDNKHDLTISVPNVNLFSVTNAVRTLFFLYYIKFKFANNERLLHRRVIFQHGFHSFGNKSIAKIASLLGFEIVDGSGKSIDRITEISDSDIHIGTRLHMNIFFLSKNRVSYLLSVDNRTEAFLKTISVPSENFTILGTKRLVDECYGDLANERLQAKVKFVRTQIVKLYSEMRGFLMQVEHFIDNEKQ